MLTGLLDLIANAIGTFMIGAIPERQPWRVPLVGLWIAVGALRSGLVVDAAGVTGRGFIVRRRLRWREIAGFRAGVEVLAPNKPSAVVDVKLVDGRWRTLPGTRVEGWLWNIDRHRRTAAAVAAALERERLRHAER